MAVAQYIAGMGLWNVGLVLVHGMAHPLGAYFDIPHGVANALLLSIVMKYNATSCVDKYADIAKAMGVNIVGLSKIEAAHAAVEAVKALAIKVGIPQKLRDLNVTEESLESLALSAFNDVCTPGNPRTVTLEDILTLYKNAL